MHPYNRALCFAAAALACTGQIDADGAGRTGVPPDTDGAGAGGARSGPGAVSGAPGTPGSTAAPGSAPAGEGTFRFSCPDPVAPAARRLRRLSRAELRAHLAGVLAGTSLQASSGARADALLAGVPDDVGDESHYAEEILETSEGHAQGLLALAEAGGALIFGLPAADHDLLSGAQCRAPAAALAACAKGIGDELGLRLLRRPLAPAELSGLERYLAGAAVSSAAQAVSNAFSYLVLQPASLLHLEDGGEPVPGRPALRLTAFEAMNRVHFGLLGAPPPIAFLKRVREPGFSRERAEQRIEEILGSSAFRARLLSFFEEWLGSGRNVDLSPLPADMTRGLAVKDVPVEAYEEMRAFLAAVAFAPRGSVADLYLSNKVHHLGPSLGVLYGLGAAPKGAVTPPRELDAARHPGLLGRVAMNLHVEAQTSPISRGVRVKRRMLCEDIHPPANLALLAGAEPIEIDDPNKYSNRFLVENKTKPPACRACHLGIDGIGFALDFYDSLGRYRTREIRYDAKGTVVNTFPLTPDITIQVLPGKTVENAGGPLTLAREIAATEVGSACFVSQWLSYTVQVDKFEHVSCLKRALHEKVVAGGPGILDMIRAAARAEIDAQKPLAPGARP
jgi:hypothetical protein